SPTITAYKRYQVGTWAPVQIAWGVENRTALVRALPAGPSTRIENRQGSSDANPYLLAAVMIAAGLDGIRRSLDPGEPVPALPLPAAAYQSRAGRGRTGRGRGTDPGPGAGVHQHVRRGAPLRLAALPQPRHRLGDQRVPRDALRRTVQLPSTADQGVIPVSHERAAGLEVTIRPARAEVFLLSLPMVRTFRSAYGQSGGRKRLIVVRLEDQDGTPGWGEAPVAERPRYCTDTAESTWSALTDML